MPTKPLLPKLTLLLLSAWGFWTLWGFPYTNGLLTHLQSKTKPGAVLPGLNPAPMKQTYTGIAPLDKQLTILVSFFYTAIDGNRLDISLQFLGLGGQVLAAWVLITIEGFRQGNSGSTLWVVTATTLFGLAVAIVGFACVAPLWFALHLLISPTARRDVSANELLVKSPLQLAFAPISIMLGFGVPSAIMTLPAPNILSFQTKQLWTGIQQGWPIWIFLTRFALTRLVSNARRTEDDERANIPKYLKRAYTFALLSSTAAHVLPWTVAIIAYVRPTLFGPKYGPQLQPSNMIAPVWPSGARHRAVTLADGALWFLQWDLIVGTAATLVWGLAVRSAVEEKERTWERLGLGLVKAGVIAALMGPCGAAVWAVWDRDELVLAGKGKGKVAGERYKSS